jgi:hypothetical protein
MKWNRNPQKRPELGQKVIIFAIDRYMKLEGHKFA